MKYYEWFLKKSETKSSEPFSNAIGGNQFFPLTQLTI